MNRLAGKTALVVGAAGSQGSRIARRMADEGASVMAADLSADALAATHADLRQVTERVEARTLDVTSDGDWAEAVSATEQAFGPLDIMVNAAAILGRQGIEGTTVEVWERVTAVNQRGTWLGLKHVAPAMRRSGRGGSIVLIGSIDGIVGRGNAAAYAASKGGTRQLAKTAAVEFAPDFIRVNCVCPGIMDTSMSVILDDGERRPDRLAMTPLKREATADDIAWAAVYLASDEARMVTGIDLMVDGGYTAQ